MFAATHTEMRAFERYILSGKKLDEALKMLVEGSDAYHYLRFLHVLVEKGKFTADERKQFDEFLQKSYSVAKDLELKSLLLSYDEAPEGEAKTKLLDKLAKNYLCLRFEDARPSEISESSASVVQSNEGQNEPLDEINMAEELQKIYDGAETYSNYYPHVLVNLDLSKIPEYEVPSVLTYLGGYISQCDSKEFYEAIAEMIKQGTDTNGYYTWNESNLNNMTLHQLMKIKELKPEVLEDTNFCGALYRKMFSAELTANQELLTLTEKRANLIKMYDFANSLPKKSWGLKSTLLLEILENGIQRDSYEEKYFNEYLQIPLRTFYCKKPAQTSGDEWKRFVTRIQSKEYQIGYTETNKKDKEILTVYLDKMFQSGKTMANYLDYFDKDFLIGVWEESQMMSGKKVEVNPSNAKRLETIKDKVLIDICKNNKETFGYGEEIELNIELKNVPSLIIKVFDINTENYYKMNMSTFRSDINLDGFIATIEKTINYSQPQSIRHREFLKLPEIKGKFGLYVIEMIGNGKSSRAVIRIGTLSLISKSTVAGQVCYLLNHERKICSGLKTGIYLDGEFYPSETKEEGKIGRVVVPFVSEERECKAILLHEGLAQLIDFLRLPEKYEFQCGFFLHPDSVIMGNKASILIKPQLLLNGKNADLSLLENIRVLVSTTNFVEDIPATKPFDDLKLNSSNELEISFNVIAHINSLSVEFQAEVKSMVKGDTQKLNAKHRYQFNTHENSTMIDELHLRVINPGPIYEILFLGKNGEPIPHTVIDVGFTHANYKNTITRSYLTDSAGIIKLGKLSGIIHIDALPSYSNSVNRTWDVPSRAFFVYPESVDLIENEPFEFPLAFESKIQLRSLESFDSKITISDCTPNLKMQKKDPQAAYSMVKIEGLKEGMYILTGLSRKCKELKIVVHKGKPWEGKPTFILTQDSLLEIPKKGQFLRIKSVKTEDKDANNATVSIQLDSSSYDKVHTHIVFYNFLSEAMDDLTLNLEDKEELFREEYPLQKWKNFYLSNRSLSSELRYCIERRQLEKLTGSTLEKPSLILKGTLIGSTTTEAEHSTAGTNFECLEEKSMPMQRRVVKQKIQQYRQQAEECECEQDMPCEAGDDYGGGGYGGGNERKENKIMEYQNFLIPPSVFWNAKPNEAGLVSISINKALLQQASGIYVVAVSPSDVAHYIQPLAIDKLKKKDLTLQKPFEQEKNYSEVRMAVGVEKNEGHVIDDITSTHFVVIDSIDLVYSILMKLANPDGNVSSEIKDFNFITHWHSLNEEEKSKLYPKYMSHELNLFLYKKDQEYFKKVIKPYLANKMEKSLIDLYLLELPLEEYYDQPHLFNELNLLEQALLVQYLVRTGKTEKAKTYAALMKNSLHRKSEESPEEKNRIFDTVLTTNALKDKKTDLENIAMLEKDKMAEGEACAEACENDEDQCDEERHEGGGGGGRGPRQRMHRRHHRHNYDEEEGESDGNEDNDAYYELEQRKKQKPAYEEKGITKEYCETNYYKTKFGDRVTIPISPFFADYANHVVENAAKPQKPFLVASFTSCESSLTSIMASVSLLDLQFQPNDHGFKSIGERSHEIKAASNLIIFKKEVKQSGANLQTTLLLGQRYLEENTIGGEDTEVKEFLTRKVYRGQTVVTNISSQNMSFDVLIQVPQGSIPVEKSTYQKTIPITLNSFTTTKNEYYFYFPSPGKFIHASPMISHNSIVIAKGKPNTLVVLAKKSKLNEEDFRDVVANGTHEQILEFIRDRPIESIKQFSWSYLYWMLKDAKFWGSLLKLLRAQGRYHNRVWEYAFYHKKDMQAIKEYLKFNSSFKSQIGYWFKNSLLDVTPADIGLRHLHYFPLVNPRVHRISSATPGGDPTILNVNMRNIYYSLIKLFMQKKNPDATDKLCLCYYLILQDRINESYKIFSTISPKQLPKAGGLKLQFDYMLAYFDFYVGQPKFEKARAIVQQYKEFPILSWKLKFLDIEQQLREYDGLENDQEEDKQTGKKKAVEAQPELHASIQGKELVVDYTKISEVEVKFYIIDLEVLFSRSPFLAQQVKDFSFVQPTNSMKIQLDIKASSKKIEMPAEYANKNLIIEVMSNMGIQGVVTFFSSSLKVHIYKSYGELQVMSTAEKLLPEVYVKVFAEYTNGQVKFYKDGYTDIRGRFDYATLNPEILKKVKRFSILIMSDKFGSVIKECKPPVEAVQIDVGEKMQAQGRLISYNKIMSQDKEGWVKSKKKG